MKRISFTLFSLFFIVPVISILFHSVSFASNPIEDAIREEFNNQNIVFNDLAYQNVINYLDGGYFENILIYVRTNTASFVASQINNASSYANSITQYPGQYQFQNCWRKSGDTTTSGTTISWNNSGNTRSMSDYSGGILFSTVADFKQWAGLSIDFDTIYYSPNIPLPDMDVYYVLTAGGGGSKVAMWNAEMSIEDNRDFYIQYGYKITVPGLVGIGLDSSTGKYDYSYDSYSEGTYVDYVSLEDMQPCINISFGSAQMSTAWQSAYDMMYDVLPDFYAKIPFWVQNPNAAKYVDAQEYYKDYMMTQLPMFGNRLELFARFFTVNEDNQVIVGDWLHWSSRTGSRTQEKPSNYIDNVELPGVINSTNDINFESESDTYTTVGETTGTTTIVNNNYAPNYPDYPTVATYNHDNILLSFMNTANQLPSLFGEFTDFLTLNLAFIPSWIWLLIGMGFTFSIVIMIIKVL